MSRFGEALRAARGARTLAAVAAPAAINAATLWQFEAGNIVPSFVVLERLTASLGVALAPLQALAEAEIVERWRSTVPPTGRLTTRGSPHGVDNWTVAAERAARGAP